jgi:four helix bundle protein
MSATGHINFRLSQLISSLPKNESCRVIGNQLLRSGTSIGANLIEAKSSSSKRDFIKYYDIALKSANESKYGSAYYEMGVCLLLKKLKV